MSANVRSYFSKVLSAARRYNASDVHIVAGLPPTVRVGGEVMIFSNMDPVNRENCNNMAKSLLNEHHFAQLERDREICVSYHFEDMGRIRVALYHRLGGIEMAIRLTNPEIKSARDLMIPDVVDQFAEKRTGLIIVTGPTGSGKTTTLNYMVDLINSSRRDRVISIEDPVEFEHTNKRSVITQIEVGTDTRDFAHFLRHVLRLDPDVIVIGEMRDIETMETALTAAETGHLVLTTLHTPTAGGSVERIVRAFEAARQPQVLLQMASTLQGAIAQRLIPSVDRKRMVLATEVLIANEAVRNVIREGKVHQLPNVIATHRTQGMHSLEHNLAELYHKGLITLDQAMIHANDSKSLKSFLNN